MRQKGSTRRASTVLRPASLGIAILGVASCLVLAVGLLTLGCLQPKPPSLSSRVGELTGKSIPKLVTGFAGDRFVAAWGTDQGVLIQPLEANGATDPAHLVPELRYVSQLLPAKDGAMLIGGNQLVPLSPDGRSHGSLVRLVEAPPGIYRTFALAEDIIAVATNDRGEKSRAVRFRTYHLDGTPAGPAATISADELGVGEIGLVQLPTKEYLLAWSISGNQPSLVTALVSDQGAVVKAPQAVYTVSRGGSVQCCWAGPTADGNAVVVWQDSSPGPWEIFVQKVGANGPLGPAKQISPGGGRDDLHPQILFDGKRNLVAWISGIHWGAFARSGSGRVSLLELDGTAKPAVFDAPSSIEGFSFTAQGDSMAVAAAVPEKTGVGIFGKVFSFKSEIAP